MHLSAIRLKGFKSFVDPVEVRLEPGVAVVVGPNGSGKSNVSDGIVWAAGSLTPSELRAEKPDDVLFAGAAGRDPADFCEVELLFDNAAGDGPIDYSELSIVRRLHRGGEGQYLVNRTAVRRIDLVAIGGRRGEAEGRKTAAALARRAADQKLEALLAERTRAEEELADAAGRRESATASLYRFRSMGERVALRRESALELLQRLRGELAEASEVPVENGATAALEAAVRTAASNARAAYSEREEAALRARQL